MMRRILTAVALSVAISLSGCAAYDYAKDNPATAAMAVKSGTLAFVEQVDPLTERIERAKEVLAVIDFVLGEVQSTPTATVATLTSTVKAQIDWNSLDAYERLLLDSLIYSIQSRLEEHVGSGILADEDKIIVNEVLLWAKGAAEMYANKEG